MVRGTKQNVLRISVFGIIFGLLVLTASVDLMAGTINVDLEEVEIDPDGDCSIAEAIINANDDTDTHADCDPGFPGLDTIILPPPAPQSGLFEFELTGAPGSFDKDGRNGLPSIESEIVIEGNGQTIERDDGLGCSFDDSSDPDEFRIFHVSFLGSLTLNDLTLKNGCVDGTGNEARGGAIFVESDELFSSAGFCCFGSGEPFGAGTLTLNNVTIEDSSANYDGGAINLMDATSITATDSSFDGNFAAEDGGAIHLEAFTEASFTNTDFTGNESDDSGGAISTDEFSEAVILGGTFSGNSADEDDDCCGDGGAIFFVGNLLIRDAYFEYNTAENGGAVLIFGSYAIENSTFFDNEAQESGGALLSINELFIASAGPGLLLFSGIFDRQFNSITNSTFFDNEAEEGGAISNSGRLDIVNSTIVSNAAYGYFAGNFGLFCFGPETLVLMADGSTKRIADIIVGERVMSYDFTLNQQVPNSVLHTLNRESESYLNINGLRVTESHPFAVGPDEWVTAGELKIGDRVLSPEGWTEISRIEEVFETLDVHTLSVENAHNFYVSDGENFYLVHNKMPLPGGGGISTDFLSRLTLKNTILADNGDGENCVAPATADIVSGGFNIDDDGSCGLNGTGDEVTDPGLDEFDDHGGPTPTFSLETDSPAIDAIPLSHCVDPVGDFLATDQRGIDRPMPSARGCDIGAFEQDSARLTIVLIGAGSGEVFSDPVDLDCPNTDCAINLPIGTELSLEVDADAGSFFAGVGGDEGCSTSEVLLVLNESITCRFTFAPDYMVLPEPETIRASAAFTAPFHCGTRKMTDPEIVGYSQAHEDSTGLAGAGVPAGAPAIQNGRLVMFEEYRTEIEITMPQKRILLIFPGPQELVDMIESATVTNPSNFQTPGLMSLPLKVQIESGKTIRLDCNDLVSLPLSIDEGGPSVDQVLGTELADFEFFQGALTISSTSSDLKVFVNKSVRRFDGTSESGGAIDLIKTDTTKSRVRIEGVRTSATHEARVGSNYVVAATATPEAIAQVIEPRFSVRSLSNSSRLMMSFGVDLLDAQSLSVTIFDLRGRMIYSQSESGNTLRWLGRDQRGRQLANGVYLYSIAALDAQGKILKSEIRKLLILR